MKCSKLMLVIFILLPAYLKAQTLKPVLFSTNREVLDLDSRGDTLIVAGKFDRVGKFVGGSGEVSTSSDQANLSFPKLNDDIIASDIDGNGGYYVLNAALELKHILANNTVDPNFLIQVNIPNSKRFVYHNNVVYFAIHDNITTDGGLVGYDVVTMQKLAGLPYINGGVRNLRIDNDKLYVIGDFSMVAGQPRNNIASIDISNYTPTNWYPQLPPQSATPGYYDIVFHGSDAVIGGYYSNSGFPNDIAKIAIVDKTTGAFDHFLYFGAGIFNNDPNSLYWAAGIFRMAIKGDTLYLTSGGTEDTRLTACNLLASSNYTLWTRYFNMIASVNDLFISGDNIYVAGWGIDDVYLKDFINDNNANIELKRVKNAIAFNTTTGAILNWHPNPSGDNNDEIKTMTLNGNRIFLGGLFTHINSYDKHCVYTYNTTTEQVLPFAMQHEPVGEVNCIKLVDSILYVAGEFDSTWGSNNYNTLRAYNIKTGEQLAWYPPYVGQAFSIEVNNQYVFIGGDLQFGSGSNVQLNLLAIDRITGQVDSWSPNPNNTVHALHLADKLYVGGNFVIVSAQQKSHIAAFDPATLQLSSWSTNIDPVSKIISNDSVIFVTQGDNAVNYGYIGLRKTDASLALLPDDNHYFSGGDMIVKNQTVLVGASNQSWFDPNYCNIRAYAGDDTMQRNTLCQNVIGYINSIELVDTNLFFAGKFTYIGTELLGTNIGSISLPANYFDNNLGISEKQTDFHNSITLFPNPAKDIVNITMPVHEKIEQIIITDNLGKVLQNHKSPSNTIQIQNLTPGNYFIKIVSENKVFTSIIVKE